MKLSHEILTLRTKHPFTIARGGSSEFRVVWVRVTDSEGNDGWGEASPSTFYGETADTVVAVLPRLAAAIEGINPWSLEEMEHELDGAIRFNGAAKSAVSTALHDLAAKRLNVPLWKMWGLDPSRSPRSSFTIGIGDAAEIRRKVAEAEEYPILKVKLGSDHDEKILDIVRSQAPDKALRVDANAAWTPKQTLRMMDVLVRHKVEFVEQPLAAHDIDGLRFVRERSPLPILADESCVTSADIPRLVGAVDGINIKLAKCGGLREALRMVAVARTHGMLVMCGCMIETSLGITAAAHLAPLLDYADLDGAALVANDPFIGVSIAGGRIALRDAPGLGVTKA
jgi:L-alanine-DL-glutamate epimerase-like enolase superfamily enzyme